MKETSRKRITVRSSLNEIFHAVGKEGGGEGGGMVLFYHL